MPQLVFICPECRYVMSMDVEKLTYLSGGLVCDCGTIIHFTLDSRASVESRRKDELRAKWRELQTRAKKVEGAPDGR